MLGVSRVGAEGADRSVQHFMSFSSCSGAKSPSPRDLAILGGLKIIVERHAPSPTRLQRPFLGTAARSQKEIKIPSSPLCSLHPKVTREASSLVCG